MTTLRIGTRGSKLALWQAHWVAEQLLARDAGLDLQVVVVKTSGDLAQSGAGGTGLGAPLCPKDKVGHQAPSLLPHSDIGLFTGELEAALLDGTIDLAVHSLKDLPCELPEGLAIAAYCKREDPRDALISEGGLALEELPPGSCIGTASLRRKALILALRPDLCCVDLRGNLDTRLRKLEESSELSAIVVAAAGLIRMGWESRISQYLSEEAFLPAPGQGVVAVEISAARAGVLEVVAGINHGPSEFEALAERSFLHTLGAGCHAPVGARAVFAEGTLVLTAMEASLDGSRVMQVSAKGTDPELVGKQAAEAVLNIKSKT